MRIFAGVVGVYLIADLTTLGLIAFTLMVALPVALELHQRGMRRVRAYEQRRRP